MYTLGSTTTDNRTSDKQIPMCDSRNITTTEDDSCTSTDSAGELTKDIIIGPRHEKNRFLAYAKTKTQISFAATAKLISAFVLAR